MSFAAPSANNNEDKAISPDLITRRKFAYRVIGAVGGVITVLLATPIVGYILSPLFQKRPLHGLVPVGPVDKFPANEPTVASITFSGPGESPITQGVYVVNKGSGDVTIFSVNCTHLGCPYEWNPAVREFFCPCHGGVFNIDGKVLGGPPPRNLDRYDAVIKGGILYAGEFIAGQARG